MMVKHLDLIDKTTEPILREGDLPTTANFVERLVGDVTLPAGYGYLKRTIGRFSEMREFEVSAKSLMKSTLRRVRAFQFDAFMVTRAEWDPDKWLPGYPPSETRMHAIKMASLCSPC